MLSFLFSRYLETSKVSFAKHQRAGQTRQKSQISYQTTPALEESLGKAWQNQRIRWSFQRWGRFTQQNSSRTRVRRSSKLRIQHWTKQTKAFPLWGSYSSEGKHTINNSINKWKWVEFNDLIIDLTCPYLPRSQDTRKSNTIRKTLMNWRQNDKKCMWGAEEARDNNSKAGKKARIK